MGDSTHVRVSVETRERVRREALALVAAIEAGFMDEPEDFVHEPINPKCCGLTFDMMIVMLLNDRERHRTRRAEEKQRRAAERKAARALREE